ncbi:hypothetical protein QUF72_15135, partial [Desulfobacterales bacterium HSG2]|nr:hypothetical protein [Desulfobacterales bacterium HSG2]
DFLPSLAGKYWNSASDQEDNGIGRINQFELRRARIRVEILKNESDPFAKYGLFQRLNTGGTQLSEQEVRNCMAVMLDKDFYEWLKNCASCPAFVKTVSHTERSAKRQVHTELALRFFVFRNIPYNGKLNVCDYLDNALVKIATDPSFSKEDEGSVFNRTFALFERSLGERAFKLWDGNDLKGKSLMSLFEVMAIWVSKNIDQIEQMSQDEQDALIREKSKAIPDDKTFQKYRAKVSGSSRLAHLLPIAEK